jgi:predicted glutamine amidotransferase
MVKSLTPLPGQSILEGFAAMAENSRTPDGDRQGDGWGVAWLDGQENWRFFGSTRPIWDDLGLLDIIPASRMFLMHARSASFPGHKDAPDYSQPFIKGSYGFVFNGLLQGVSLPFPVPGRIGSQKIWALLLRQLKESDPVSSLCRVEELLENNSRRIQALNIGLCDKTHLHACCRYDGGGDYYQLYFHSSPALNMISSEPLDGHVFSPVPLGRPLTL